MARKVIYRQSGNPAEVLSVVEVDAPGPPGAGQVLVRVHAFPIHIGDLLPIQGPYLSQTEYLTPGLEATGVVEAVGPDTPVAAGVTTGARVSFFPHPGAWSEFVLVPAEFVVPVSDDVPDSIAAQMLINPITVIMLRRELQKHAAVGFNGVFLQTAAGSNVGRLLSAVAQFHAIQHINIVRSDSGAQTLRERYPAVPVVSTARPTWKEEIREHIGERPVPAAVDPVGGALAGDLLRLLSPGGTVIIYGVLAKEPIPVHAGDLLGTSLGLRGLIVTRWAEIVPAEQRAHDMATAAQLIARGAAEAFDVAAQYGIDEITQAVEHAVRPGKTTGMVLVTIP
ncbi:zinc-binding dehydrogenase [Nonomuraea sp. NPDC052116]|uniref:alcohol dehydrogenase catalytic domain-containing protein n=1 Tax=Nonomuraea sp. NPDC052116 TaxID=3155665 RepID=UPI003413B526